MGDTPQSVQLPVPDRAYHQTGDADISMDIMPETDDNEFTVRRVPGGKFGLTISHNFTYASHECRHSVTLGQDAAEQLVREAADELGLEVTEQ